MKGIVDITYLGVLVSIVLGLGLAEILKGIGSYFKNIRHTRGGGLLIVWIVLAIVGINQFWWQFWNLGRVPHEITEYLLCIFVCIFFYLYGSMVLPDFSSPDVARHFLDTGKKYNLSVYYKKNVIGLSIVVILLIIFIWIYESSILKNAIPKEGISTDFIENLKSNFEGKKRFRMFMIGLLLVTLSTGVWVNFIDKEGV